MQSISWELRCPCLLISIVIAFQLETLAYDQTLYILPLAFSSDITVVGLM